MGSFVGLNAITFGMKLLEGGWAKKESMCLMSFPSFHSKVPGFGLGKAMDEPELDHL